MKPLKRIERYISALFTLGRVKGMAKDAATMARAVQPRMDRLEDRAEAAEQHVAQFQERLTHAHERTDVVNRDLGAMQAALDVTRADLSALHARAAPLERRVDALENRMDPLEARAARHDGMGDELVAEYRREAAALNRSNQSNTALLAGMFSDLSRRMDRGAEPPAGAALAPIDLPHTQGFEAFKDSFYHRLENQWRGAPDEIARRLKVYLPDIEAAWTRTGQKPVMDLGCGRGEWLGLLRDHDIAGFGIDTNVVQIEDAQADGLDVRAGDALAALVAQPDDSLSALTAHHLIEHLPFDAVAWITREARRVLAPGGILLFETPHTGNVLVGATSFHTDPTHLKPMPEQVMGVLLETAGFEAINLRGLNPHERLGEFLDLPDFNDELAMLMFGAQDLAILGRKPQPDEDA